MPSTTYACDAFVLVTDQWNRVGISPYLDVADFPNNYIIESGITIAQIESYFGFQDSGAENANVLDAVTLRVRGYKLDSSGVLLTRYSIWDGAAWSAYADLLLPAVMGDVDVDVSAILDTWAKLDAARVRFYYRGFDAGDQAVVDKASLISTWHVAAAGGGVGGRGFIPFSLLLLVHHWRRLQRRKRIVASSLG